MKIRKRFYHGTSLVNYNSIIDDGKLSKGDYVCLTDDFDYAKTYALLSSSSSGGVVLMFRQTVDLSIKTWIIYFFKRNVLRPIFRNNIWFNEWFTHYFNSWGYATNALELCRNNILTSEIENVYKVF